MGIYAGFDSLCMACTSLRSYPPSYSDVWIAGYIRGKYDHLEEYASFRSYINERLEKQSLSLK